MTSPYKSSSYFSEYTENKRNSYDDSNNIYNMQDAKRRDVRETINRRENINGEFNGENRINHYDGDKKNYINVNNEIEIFAKKEYVDNEKQINIDKKNSYEEELNNISRKIDDVMKRIFSAYEDSQKRQYFSTLFQMRDINCIFNCAFFSLLLIFFITQEYINFFFSLLLLILSIQLRFSRSYMFLLNSVIGMITILVVSIFLFIQMTNKNNNDLINFHINLMKVQIALCSMYISFLLLYMTILSYCKRFQKQHSWIYHSVINFFNMLDLYLVITYGNLGFFSIFSCLHDVLFIILSFLLFITGLFIYSFIKYSNVILLLIHTLLMFPAIVFSALCYAKYQTPPNTPNDTAPILIGNIYLFYMIYTSIFLIFHLLYMYFTFSSETSYFIISFSERNVFYSNIHPYLIKRENNNDDVHFKYEKYILKVDDYNRIISIERKESEDIDINSGKYVYSDLHLYKHIMLQTALDMQCILTDCQSKSTNGNKCNSFVYHKKYKSNEDDYSKNDIVINVNSLKHQTSRNTKFYKMNKNSDVEKEESRKRKKNEETDKNEDEDEDENTKLERCSKFSIVSNKIFLLLFKRVMIIQQQQKKNKKMKEKEYINKYKEYYFTNCTNSNYYTPSLFKSKYTNILQILLDNYDELIFYLNKKMNFIQLKQSYKEEKKTKCVKSETVEENPSFINCHELTREEMNRQLKMLQNYEDCSSFYSDDSLPTHKNETEMHDSQQKPALIDQSNDIIVYTGENSQNVTNTCNSLTEIESPLKGIERETKGYNSNSNIFDNRSNEIMCLGEEVLSDMKRHLNPWDIYGMDSNKSSPFKKSNERLSFYLLNTNIKSSLVGSNNVNNLSSNTDGGYLKIPFYYSSAKLSFDENQTKEKTCFWYYNPGIIARVYKEWLKCKRLDPKKFHNDFYYLFSSTANLKDYLKSNATCSQWNEETPDKNILCISHIKDHGDSHLSTKSGNKRNASSLASSNVLTDINSNALDSVVSNFLSRSPNKQIDHLMLLKSKQFHTFLEDSNIIQFLSSNCSGTKVIDKMEKIKLESNSQELSKQIKNLVIEHSQQTQKTERSIGAKGNETTEKKQINKYTYFSNEENQQKTDIEKKGALDDLLNYAEMLVFGDGNEDIHEADKMKGNVSESLQVDGKSLAHEESVMVDFIGCIQNKKGEIIETPQIKKQNKEKKDNLVIKTNKPFFNSENVYNVYKKQIDNEICENIDNLNITDTGLFCINVDAVLSHEKEKKECPSNMLTDISSEKNKRNANAPISNLPNMKKVENLPKKEKKMKETKEKDIERKEKKDAVETRELKAEIIKALNNGWRDKKKEKNKNDSNEPLQKHLKSFKNNLIESYCIHSNEYNDFSKNGNLGNEKDKFIDYEKHLGFDAECIQLIEEKNKLHLKLSDDHITDDQSTEKGRNELVKEIKEYMYYKINKKGEKEIDIDDSVIMEHIAKYRKQNENYHINIFNEIVFNEKNNALPNESNMCSEGLKNIEQEGKKDDREKLNSTIDINLLQKIEKPIINYYNNSEDKIQDTAINPNLTINTYTDINGCPIHNSSVKKTMQKATSVKQKENICEPEDVPFLYNENDTNKTASEIRKADLGMLFQNNQIENNKKSILNKNTLSAEDKKTIYPINKDIFNKVYGFQNGVSEGSIVDDKEIAELMIRNDAFYESFVYKSVDDFNVLKKKMNEIKTELKTDKQKHTILKKKENCKTEGDFINIFADDEQRGDAVIKEKEYEVNAKKNKTINRITEEDINKKNDMQRFQISLNGDLLNIVSNPINCSITDQKIQEPNCYNKKNATDNNISLFPPKKINDNMNSHPNFVTYSPNEKVQKYGVKDHYYYNESVMPEDLSNQTPKANSSILPSNISNYLDSSSVQKEQHKHLVGDSPFNSFLPSHDNVPVIIGSNYSYNDNSVNFSNRDLLKCSNITKIDDHSDMKEKYKGVYGQQNLHRNLNDQVIGDSSNSLLYFNVNKSDGEQRNGKIIKHHRNATDTTTVTDMAEHSDFTDRRNANLSSNFASNSYEKVPKKYIDIKNRYKHSEEEEEEEEEEEKQQEHEKNIQQLNKNKSNKFFNSPYKQQFDKILNTYTFHPDDKNTKEKQKENEIVKVKNKEKKMIDSNNYMNQINNLDVENSRHMESGNSDTSVFVKQALMLDESTNNLKKKKRKKEKKDKKQKKEKNVKEFALEISDNDHEMVLGKIKNSVNANTYLDRKQRESFKEVIQNGDIFPSTTLKTKQNLEKYINNNDVNNSNENNKNEMSYLKVSDENILRPSLINSEQSSSKYECILNSSVNTYSRNNDLSEMENSNFLNSSLNVTDIKKIVEVVNENNEFTSNLSNTNKSNNAERNIYQYRNPHIKRRGKEEETEAEETGSNRPEMFSNYTNILFNPKNNLVKKLTKKLFFSKFKNKKSLGTENTNEEYQKEKNKSGAKTFKHKILDLNLDSKSSITDLYKNEEAFIYMDKPNSANLKPKSNNTSEAFSNVAMINSNISLESNYNDGEIEKKGNINKKLKELNKQYASMQELSKKTYINNIIVSKKDTRSSIKANQNEAETVQKTKSIEDNINDVFNQSTAINKQNKKDINNHTINDLKKKQRRKSQQNGTNGLLEDIRKNTKTESKGEKQLFTYCPY